MSINELCSQHERNCEALYQGDLDRGAHREQMIEARASGLKLALAPFSESIEPFNEFVYDWFDSYGDVVSKLLQITVCNIGDVEAIGSGVKKVFDDVFRKVAEHQIDKELGNE